MVDMEKARLDELAGRVSVLEGRLRAVERGMRWRVPSAIGTDDEFEDEQCTRTAEDESVALREALGFEDRPVVVAAPAPATAIRTTDLEVLREEIGRSRERREMQNARVLDELESKIGRNWTSWVGAVVLVLGVCFFLKYAWDQGWLAFAPGVRVAMTIGAGAAFGVAGEWVRRRAEGMRALAGTLTGVGVAIVMAAFFSGATMFNAPVFSPRVAMIGVCATAAVGIWRAVGMDVMSVAVIALLGAYLAPAALGSGRDESALLLTYLGALTACGLVLSYLKPRWAVLRWFTFSCTGVWVGVWVLWFGARGVHRPLGMGAVAVFLAGFVGEAYLTIQRGYRNRDALSPAVESALATQSMLTTAGAFAACYVLLPMPAEAGGLFHLSPIAAIAVGLASLHGMIAVATPSRAFARSSALQSAALLTLAVPLTLGGVAVTIAWVVLAVALAGLEWRRGREDVAVRAWVVVLLGLVVARLFTLDLMNAGLSQVVLQIGEQGVSGWLLMAFAVAIAAHGIGWLLAAGGARAEREVGLPAIIAAVGTAVFFVSTAMVWHRAALTVLWLAWVAVPVALAPRGGRLGYATHAAVALFAVACKWVTFDGLMPIAAQWDDPAGAAAPVFNLVALCGGAIALLAARLGRRADDQTRAVVPVGVGLVAFLGLNFETLRAVDYFADAFADFATAKLVALSVLWAVVGLAAVVVGFAKNLRPLRYAALALLGVTLGKILFVDLAAVRPVYRILSFLAVGGLLLCTSFVYHRNGDVKCQKSNVKCGGSGG